MKKKFCLLELQIEFPFILERVKTCRIFIFPAYFLKNVPSYRIFAVIFPAKNAQIVGHRTSWNSFPPSLRPPQYRPKSPLNAPEIQMHVECVSG